MGPVHGGITHRCLGLNSLLDWRPKDLFHKTTYIDYSNKLEEYRIHLHLGGGQAGGDDWPLRGRLGE